MAHSHCCSTLLHQSEMRLLEQIHCCAAMGNKVIVTVGTNIIVGIHCYNEKRGPSWLRTWTLYNIIATLTLDITVSFVIPFE